MKAKWIISSDGYYPYCSNCGEEPYDGELHDFCPSCQADMRVSVKEHKTIIKRLFNKSQD